MYAGYSIFCFGDLSQTMVCSFITFPLLIKKLAWCFKFWFLNFLKHKTNLLLLAKEGEKRGFATGWQEGT